MKNKTFVCFFVGFLLFFGCIQSQTSENENNQTIQAKETLKSIKNRMLLAEDKAKDGDLNESLNDYSDIKKLLEPYVFDEEVNAIIREEVVLRYDEVKLKINELKVQIANVQNRNAVANLLPDYQEQYKKLLSQELELTKEYKYNPTVFSAIKSDRDFVNHCSKTKPKIFDLKSKLEELYSTLILLNLSNSDNLEMIKQDLNNKVSISLNLTNLIFQDYENWCKTRQINSEISEFEEALEKNSPDYDRLLYCYYDRRGEELVRAEEERFNFMNSSNFSTMRQIIKDNNYPFDPFLDKISYYIVEFEKFGLVSHEFLCEFTKTAYEYDNTVSEIKLKYKYYTDVVSNSDILLLKNKINDLINSCAHINRVEKTCKNLQNNYPNDSKTLFCDYEKAKIGCKTFEEVARTLNQKNSFTYEEIFGRE